MLQAARTTRVVENVAPDQVPYEELLQNQEPVIFKGLVREWPLCRTSTAREAADYLKTFYQGRRILAFIAPPENRGRFAYNDDLNRFNFESDREGLLDEYLDRILECGGNDVAPSIYIGSTDVDQFLPGFRKKNDLVLGHEMFKSNPVMVGAWIGNRTTALAHYDMSNNFACCVVGRRRFTLFPPEQIANLYPGPLEPTPGGQVLTTTDINTPDFERFPRLRDALAAAEVAELKPGDVLFYPAMWWHQVDALEDFNIMINYWWNTSPAFIDTPQNTLLHAMLSLRDRPEQEKRAWRAVFDYYIFGPADRAAEHLPEAARGNLAPMDEIKARRLRAQLLQRLNR